MFRVTPGFLAAIWIVLSGAAVSVRAAGDAVPTSQPFLEARLDASLRKGADFLKSQQKSGHWERFDRPTPDLHNWAGEHWGSRTALAVSALQIGRNGPRDTPEANPILDSPLLVDPISVAIKAHYFRSNFPHGAAEKAQQRLIDLTQPAPGAIVDLRVLAHASLGLTALLAYAERAPDAYWKSVTPPILKLQNPDGGWARGNDPAADPIATVQALIVLATARCERSSSDAAVAGDAALPAIDAALERGLAWVDQHADACLHPASNEDLWFLRQLGLITGRKRFGGKNVVADLADAIIRRQNRDGSWGDPARADAVAETSFAMQMLWRIDLPVLVGKLIYRAPGQAAGTRLAGDHRPWDVAHFATDTATLCVAPNWRRIDLADDDRSDASDCAILVITGVDPVALTPVELDRLRQFIERGGTLIGNAENQSPAFLKSFDAIGRQLFPGRHFRPLPMTDPIFENRIYSLKDIGFTPEILSLGNGVREQMILLTGRDYAAGWQESRHGSRMRSPEVRVGLNLILYAVGRNFSSRLDESVDVPLPPTIVRRINVARLLLGLNPDPEPNTWRRLAALLAARDRVALTVTPIVNLTDLDATRCPLAHLTGVGELKLDAAQLAPLRRYLNAGGTLLIDAAGGDAAFASSADAIAVALSDDPKQPPNDALPWDHAMFKAIPLERPQFRQFATQQNPSIRKSAGLRPTYINGRVAILVSHEDLTAGAAGVHSDGIIGYDVETATQIMRNVVRSVAKPEPPRP